MRRSAPPRTLRLLVYAGLYVLSSSNIFASSKCMAFAPPPRHVLSSTIRYCSCLKMSSSSNGPPSDTRNTKIIRILALHGKGNTGPSFAKALEPLESALAARLEISSSDKINNNVSFEFDYPTAPYSLGDDTDGKAWWTLAPGERSFTAEEYIGYDTSASLVEDKLCSGDGFDFVLGHSQGAILLSALLATSERISKLYTKSTSSWSDTKERRKPIGYIFNGCAVPNPFKEKLEMIEFPRASGLFIIGDSDEINPPAGAEQVRDCLASGGMPIETLRHRGGHSVPVKDLDALGMMADWIVDVEQRKNAS